MAKGSIEVISNGQSSGYVDDNIILTRPKTEVTRISGAKAGVEIGASEAESNYAGTYVYKRWDGIDSDGKQATVTMWIERGTE